MFNVFGQEIIIFASSILQSYIIMAFENQHLLNKEFLQTFPLESLKDMTLDQYTNLNRADSFCYWLESKTTGLGSVWGGSSYKFGIYRYGQKPEGKMKGRLCDDKYAWFSSLGKTADEAFKTIKDALIRIATAAKDGDLDAIESINQLGTVIKWKIAFLYSNEKFVPYYSIERLRVIAREMGMADVKDATLADFQRFLINHRDGRDIHEYGVFLDDIWKDKHVIVDENGLEQNIDNNQNDNESQMKYQLYMDLLRENRNLVLTGAPGTGKTFMAQAIAKEMGAEVKFVQFHPSYDYTDFVEGLRPVDNGNGQMGFERKDGVFKEFCKAAIVNISSDKDTKATVSTFIKGDFSTIYNSIVSDIKTGNLIEYKTPYKVQSLAVDANDRIVFRANTDRSRTEREDNVKLMFDYFVSKGIRDLSKHTREDYWSLIKSLTNGKTSTIDYIEYGWLLQEMLNRIDNEIDFSTANIDKVEKKPFVMIIDEVNRGEASKIFGELFYAIDPGYRGKTDVLVQTQYQNLVPDTDVFAKGFYVPDNVYILATMNDIDRSVESMDFAMRRRFTWKEVTPTDTQDMLDSLGVIANEAKATMARLNEVIADTDGLGDAYMVGPSYFLKLASNGGDFEKLWIMNIEPLLKEYLRGFRKANETIEKFKEAYFAEEETTDNELDLVDED